ncbi:hypothetical protein CYMTET_8159 [Cymbomonas tetramitiformis]|uniref:ADP,ATP carrier protein n=1 Tax=Cymbomonas tetramitiformis TaxID=36881 RepID=A0AAE0GTR4_9CHLO|nr:hypothetical protein CYMTET_8159 [Cymbomonas tetramitiformis]|eukprot:gene20746-24865_t
MERRRRQFAPVRALRAVHTLITKECSAQELWSAGSSAAALACLYCGYEVIRSTSNARFNSTCGAAQLPYLATVATPCATASLAGISKVVDHRGVRAACNAACAACAAGFIVAWAVHAASPAWACPSAVLIYLLRESYVMILSMQVWSFLNSSIRKAHAELLFGPIQAVGILGGTVGGLLVQQTIFSADTLLISTSLTAIAGFYGATRLGFVSAGEPSHDRPLVRFPVGTEDDGSKIYLAKGEVAKLTWREKVGLLEKSVVLQVLFVVTVMGEVVGSNVMFGFQRALQGSGPEDEQRRFSGRFYIFVNLTAGLMQITITPLVLSRFSLRTVHIGLAVAQTGTVLGMLAYPSIQKVALAYLMRKVQTYSVLQAAKQLSYIPLSFDARYHAKGIVDVLGARAGKAIASVVVICLDLQGATVTLFINAFVAVLACFAWLIATLCLPHKA